jgi:hypothetical protein
MRPTDEEPELRYFQSIVSSPTQAAVGFFGAFAGA